MRLSFGGLNFFSYICTKKTIKYIMEKWEKAQELLQEKINKCDFKDEVYTMVDDIISNNIVDIEKELEMNESDILDDDVAWYDEIKEDMRQTLYERISKWLSKDN